MAQNAKAISSCKILYLGQKIKLPKTCQKRFYKHIRAVLCKKNGSKKQVIFEEREHFKNGPKWPKCKGYSSCRILYLGQKIKLPETLAVAPLEADIRSHPYRKGIVNRHESYRDICGKKYITISNFSSNDCQRASRAKTRGW